jgi:hypothetical protein
MSSYRTELHSERIRNRTDRIELNGHKSQCINERNGGKKTDKDLEGKYLPHDIL